MFRYLKRLESKDLSYFTGMNSLGSAELIPISWPEFSNIHPYAPFDQTKGYLDMIDELSRDLSEITGFVATSVQPNSGLSGRFAGLLCLKEYFTSKRQNGMRNVCLVPASAYKSNINSITMSGLTAVTINTDVNGNIELEDFKSKLDEYKLILIKIKIK